VTLHLLLVLLQDLDRATWTVEGVEREALVRAPAKAGEGKPPLVFGFHGHGGTMRNAARSFRLHELWPEAVVVYPQGLNTPGRLSDPEGKRPGWQHGAGDQGDRDLKFFDAMLAAMKEKPGVDPSRVYAMGHSNGGQFTYLLWTSRPGVFAAVAPSGAVAGRGIEPTTPCPVLHVAGEKDPLVKFEWQRAGWSKLRAANGCEETPKPWGPPGCEIYASTRKAPVVTYIHPGGHEYPKEAPELVVKFLKEHLLIK
jgi:polyhydroxybutyrate depolymerase